MKIESFDTSKQVLVIAEIGNNHEGDYALAEKLICLAAKAGAGAVKFQTFKTEYFANPKDSKRFQQLKSFELSEEQFKRLKEVACNEGLLFLSTPMDIESARFLRGLVPAYKIASSDNNFYPLIKEIARTGKPVILSSGLVDLENIQSVLSFIHQIWRGLEINQQLAVLHCVTSYPVSSEEANLGAILHLRRELKCTVGYSDHTVGIEAAVLAVALGARVIEKHFTIDKNYSSFRDHRLSVTPEDMSLLVRRIKEVQVLLGSGQKVVQKSEREIMLTLRRSIIAKRDLSGGSVIGWEDIGWTRPAGGLSPGQEELILGKVLSRSVKMGEWLVPEIFK